MSYTTAITDRVLSDVTTPTSKGYFNIVDWTRVYNNSKLVRDLVQILEAVDIVFNTITLPTISSSPQLVGSLLNTVLNNIETLRLAVIAETIPDALTEIKDDWAFGANEEAPKYTHANIWEKTIDAIWEYYNGSNLDVCPTLTSNLTINNGETYIVVDCIDPDVYEIIINGSGVLHII